ncbi:MAG TPA: tol-pal system protein YbgF [Deltaproteobacteria bacterium]|nr:tol-pal system protein YbgF [Deltaproteobacteria bacterium]
MEKKPVVFIGVALFLAGCAASAPVEDGSVEKALAARTDELKIMLVQTNIKLDELADKLSLLSERVAAMSAERRRLEARRAALEGSGSGETQERGGAAVPHAGGEALHGAEEPPHWLEVVELGGEEARRGERRGGVDAAPGAKERKEVPERLYRLGQELFMAEKYADARAVFDNLIDNFPDHELSDNALYWSGETFYSERDYRSALERFSEVAARYPQGNKAPDALLKVAFSHIELYEMDRAREALKGLVERYPDSKAAERARKTLREVEGLK